MTEITTDERLTRLEQALVELALDSYRVAGSAGVRKKGMRALADLVAEYEQRRAG